MRSSLLRKTSSARILADLDSRGPGQGKCYTFVKPEWSVTQAIRDGFMAILGTQRLTQLSTGPTPPIGALVKRLTAKIFGSAPVEGTVRCLTIGG